MGAERCLPTGPHWSRYKAQLWQESRLDPATISPVGVRGLALGPIVKWGAGLAIGGALWGVIQFGEQRAALARLRRINADNIRTRMPKILATEAPA